jgi:hypothetical protein
MSLLSLCRFQLVSVSVITISVSAIVVLLLASIAVGILVASPHDSREWSILFWEESRVSDASE